MIKNILNVTMFILIIFFSVFVISHYLSEKNKKKILLNRVNIDSNIYKKINNLPILKNDTSNIIEFNSGYQTNEEKNVKRKFWDLIKSK